ncbi:MAG: hypothetical protein MRECE_11c034 [Mycoplasmataceae bacterium CE_OT135]|nr:MAG: hypothetical protein MRECE_11c034 [Mycoplasmataceae bacterium CE_OT135]
MLKKPKTQAQLQAEITKLKAEKAQLRTYFCEIIEIAYQAINQESQETTNKLKNATSVQLLQELGQRIATREIKKQDCNESDGFISLYIGNQSDKKSNYFLTDYEMKMYLEDGEIKFNRVDKDKLNTDKEEESHE